MTDTKLMFVKCLAYDKNSNYTTIVVIILKIKNRKKTSSGYLFSNVYRPLSLSFRNNILFSFPQ